MENFSNTRGRKDIMSEEQVMNQKEIGKRLTEIMRLHDISEKELAMHLGRDETTIIVLVIWIQNNTINNFVR